MKTSVLFFTLRPSMTNERFSVVSASFMPCTGAEAVEAFTAEQALILVLEDLHWSDYATDLGDAPQAPRLFCVRFPD